MEDLGEELPLGAQVRVADLTGRVEARTEPCVGLWYLVAGEWWPAAEVEAAALEAA